MKTPNPSLPSQATAKPHILFKKSALSLFPVLLVLMALWQLWSSSVYAQSNPPPNPACPNVVNTGGGSCVSGPVQLSAQEQTIMAKKNALAQEYALVRAGKFSLSTFQQDYQAFLQQYARSALNMPTTFSVPYCPTSIVPSVGTSGCGSRNVYVPQQPQATSSYCGPATADEILLGRGATTGPRGESLSQQVLANNNYLQTDTNGGTNWNPAVMSPTLNAWTRTSFYGSVNGSGVGGGFSEATFSNDLTLDINGGWALAGNVVEQLGKVHLTGHPVGETIYHWIAINGYTNYGSKTSYVDSVSGTGFWSWSPKVPPYSTIPSTDMTTMLNGRGFIW